LQDKPDEQKRLETFMLYCAQMSWHQASRSDRRGLSM